MMKPLRILAFATLAAFVLSAPALAHGFKVGDLDIGHPWSRATPNGASIGGGYLSVTNNGKTPDRLIGVSMPTADHGEIHEMKMDNGVMQMRPLEKGIEIKPGETVKFEPGGYHLMFMGLKAPFKEGEMVKGQLKFEKAGTVDVEFKIEGIGFKPKDGGMGGMKMEHKH